MMSDKVKESIQVALRELHDERERIDVAIANLETFLGNLLDSAAADLDSGDASNAWDMLGSLSQKPPRTIAAKQRSREGWTPQARQAAAERMRKRWEAHREAVSQGGAVMGRVGRRPRTVRNAADLGDSEGERSRKGWTEEARAAASERMQKQWQQKRRHNVASATDLA